ncbi:MAG: SagB/ThcOx family dehydrogenase [Candidatus Fermentibacteraceae bacterium]
MLLLILALTGIFRIPSSIVLPSPETEGGMSLFTALAQRRSVRSYSGTDSLTLEQLSRLLWAAQGKTGTRGRRTAPSAGATYPLEVLCIIDRVSGAEPGLYRYDPVDHILAPTTFSVTRVSASDIAGACYGQSWMGNAPAFIVIVVDYTRTTDHYGERGVRYVDMEAGHAGQNIYLMAAALNLATCAVGAFDEDALAELLGLRGQTPVYIFPVGAPE